VVPPVVEDFMVSSLYCRMFRALLKDASKLECWMRRTAPVDSSTHERIFAPAKLRFAAPSCGFVFAASALDEPLAEADANLHAVMRKYAEQLMEGMPQGPNFTARTREIIVRHLAAGAVNIGAVARELHMSARTLGRRLEGEGTTFTDLVDDIRKRMAMRYVGTQSHALSEVAFMLGFAHPAAFHRAFKRWTGQTPLRYRSGHQLHA
jgi:AraC-like DNA-binding protein